MKDDKPKEVIEESKKENSDINLNNFKNLKEISNFIECQKKAAEKANKPKKKDNNIEIDFQKFPEMIQNLVEIDNYKLLKERLGFEPVKLEEELNSKKSSSEIDRQLLLKCILAFNYTNELIFKEKNNKSSLS